MKMIKTAIGLFFFITFIYFITAIAALPDEILVRKDTVNRFDFNLPFDIQIEPESVTVLNINNQAVSDNIKIDIAKPFTVSSDETGTASITFNAMGIPLKKVKLDIRPELELVPCGMTVGVKINTEGVMVLGTGFVKTEDGNQTNPSEGKLLSGDMLLSANGQELFNKKDLISVIENSEGEVNFRLRRNSETIEAKVTPVKSTDTNKNKIGLWVRDSMQGIGTVTYFNPSTNHFAALGHGIVDIDTKRLITIRTGEIIKSDIVSVKKGSRGEPGELIGEIDSSKVLGTVQYNSPVGIYGTMDYGALGGSMKKMPVGLQADVHEGPAKILSNVERGSTREYDIYIESVNKFSSDDSKGMIIRITDPELLRITSGIVQGMSGSPIIQDDKLIGAVTHVFVQSPTKGYGIFIENMLSQER